MASTDLSLFPDELLPAQPCSTSRAPPAALARSVRVQMPDRRQLEMRAVDLESTIPDDHRARTVWAYVEQVNLGALYARIKAVEGGVGRSPIAPEVLLALWLFATLEGVGSARAVARLTDEHDAYRWLCGGVSVNYHTLADFRVGHGNLLDELLTSSVASLLSVGAVKMTRLAQDGMRVRASAGSKSFRRKATLEECLKQAKERVAKLKSEIDVDPSGPSRREAAARNRVARERQEKIEQALRRLPKLEEAKARQNERSKKKVKEARVSMTDPEATIMKMPNGGYNPAYNAQFCTDTESQVIVGVDMLMEGTDHGQLTPMLEQVEARYVRTPNEYLVDGGYVSVQQIEAVESKCTVYAPVPERSRDTLEPHAPHPKDTPGVARWRARMGTEEAKAIYKDRASTAECVNALARERGLTRLRVRGVEKTKAVLTIYALAHNLMRIAKLAPQLLGFGPQRFKTA
jgi:transposase